MDLGKCVHATKVSEEKLFKDEQRLLPQTHICCVIHSMNYVQVKQWHE